MANNALLGYRKRRTSNAHTASSVPSSIEVCSQFPSYYPARSNTTPPLIAPQNKRGATTTNPSNAAHTVSSLSLPPGAEGRPCPPPHMHIWSLPLNVTMYSSGGDRLFAIVTSRWYGVWVTSMRIAAFNSLCATTMFIVVISPPSKMNSSSWYSLCDSERREVCRGVRIGVVG